MTSKYWDEFDKRIGPTVRAVRDGKIPPLRRIAVHLTNRCNMHCAYCNENKSDSTMDFGRLMRLAHEFNDMGGGVLHLTGGEPTMVPYLSTFAQSVNKLPNIMLNMNTNMMSSKLVLNVDLVRCFKRLKVSLDTLNDNYFDNLVGISGAFSQVIRNLICLDEFCEAVPTGTPKVSVTCVVTSENYRNLPAFARAYYHQFRAFSALFFSIYKGKNPRFSFLPHDVYTMFNDIYPQLLCIFDEFHDAESKELFIETHSKEAYSNSIRFKANLSVPCYLSLSELTIDSSGKVYNCSHLFRDGAGDTGLNIREFSLKDLVEKVKMRKLEVPHAAECAYGCNQRLIKFNEEVSIRLQKGE
jgi:MoaA/NifB/PqqE/SkfB family radical SAM enzyme